MAENKREINTNPLIGIIWFFIGVIMEWFAIIIQKGDEWERIARQYPDAGATGTGGWTLLIFFIITLIALVVYLIKELCEITYVSPSNRTEGNPSKIETIE